MERVLIRSIDLAPTWSLVFEMAPLVPILATVARAILGDRVPVIAWDDSGPAGALVFPGTPEGYRLAEALRDQLNDALQVATLPCPAESFPEPADFAEPFGGEDARILREEAAHLAALRNARGGGRPKVGAAQEYGRALRPGSLLAATVEGDATAADVLRAASLLMTDDVEHHRYAGWAPGDRFIVLDPDDVARHASALHLWPTWGGKAAGTVITRCDRHHDGHDTSAGLLIECDGLPRPIVVSPRVLSACARKVL